MKCSNISTVDNYCKLSWSDNVRYLGIYLGSSRTFACSFSHAKQSMYRAFNAVFCKVGRSASPDVVLQLVKSKCLPALCYGVNVCPVNKSQTASLQYVVDNCFRKIFDIKLTEIVRHCMSEIKLTMCDMINIKKRKFLEKFSISENSLCHVIVHMCNPR